MALPTDAAGDTAPPAISRGADKGAAPALPLEGRPGWITWRSMILGTLAVILVCGLVPYNDYVVANTFIIGSYFPPILVICFLVLVVLVNAPLHRWMPRWALSPGELAVIMVMMLASCAIPAQGLMRSLVPTLVVPFYHGQLDGRFYENFQALDLPTWLFPVTDYEDARTNPVITDFVNRIQEGASVPYAAWVVPLAGWGVFFFGLWVSLVAMAALLRRQWAVNERLPFPIAQLQIALIEPPRPGHMLNSLFRSRIFWFGLIGVFAVQSTVALHHYHPQYIPEIPLRYDLAPIMADEPWVHFHGSVKAATVYFTFIGITYFIQSRVGFSLWGIFLILKTIDVQQRMMQSEIPPPAWHDQHLGASVAFLAGVFWIGRHHWATIWAQVVRGRRKGEVAEDFISYRVALFAALGGMALMILWLIALDVQAWVAVVIVAFLLLAHLVTARIVAETGLPFIRSMAHFTQLYPNFSPASFTGKDVFFIGAFTMNGHFTTRESLLTFSMHGLQVADSTDPPPRQRRVLLGLIMWAVLLGFIVASISSLYCYYHYATPITAKADNMINPGVLDNMGRVNLVESVNRMAEGRFPARPHNPWLHIGIGAGVTGFLQFAALRWTSWPFMPVGYLVHPTWFIHMAWFSIFLGWVCKVLIVKYGGASLFQKARPFFIGIIFGEAVAAGVWLLITIFLARAGYEYEIVHFLPA